MRTSLWSIGLFALVAAMPRVAHAQGARTKAQKDAPLVKPPAAAQAQTAQPSPQVVPQPTTPPTPDENTGHAAADPEQLLKTHAGGLTADQVARRAVDTSFSVKQSLELMHAAQERVSQQWATYLPRLTGTARYTRLSSFTVPDINFGTQQNPVIVPGSTIYPLFLDQYLLQANLTVPISDYFLKLNQNVEAARRTAEAARYDLGAQRAAAYSNGKVSYYAWMQARGQVIVAIQTVNDQRAHFNDSRNQFAVGNANKADVLRADTAVSSAEVALETAKNAAALAETQMRIALHLPAGTNLEPGEGLEVAPPLFQGNLEALVQEGLSSRYQIKSVLSNAEAARRTAASYKGQQWPVVSAFGDGTYADPNARLFPAQQKWFPTWDAGLRRSGRRTTRSSTGTARATTRPARTRSRRRRR